MRELSVAEQRYKAVLAVIADGKSVTDVAAEWRVSGGLFQFWVGNELLKTVARTGSGPIRKKNASGTSPRPR